MYDEWLYLFHSYGFVIFQAHKPDFPFLVLFDEWLDDFFFHVSKLFFWLIRDLIEVLSSSNLNADHFNLAKIDLLI